MGLSNLILSLRNDYFVSWKDSAKSSLLDSAKVFNLLGYRSVLVDFRGSGGSTGSSTTIGVRESQDVALVFQHVHKLESQQANNIVWAFLWELLLF